MSKVIYRTENFADLSKYVVSDDVFHDLQVAASDITSNVRYDMRCSLFDYNTRIDSTWEWYYNYLNTQFELSKMFPEYKEELSALLTLAQTDPNPNISRAATEAVNVLNK